MRKWRDLAAPDDSESWYSVVNMWPTRRGTYESADLSSSSNVTGLATTIGAIKYAYSYGYVSGAGPQEYLAMLDNSVTVLYSWDGTTLTSRLVTTGTNAPMMVKYGAVTLATRMGSGGGPTYNLYVATSFGSGFTSVAAAPAYQLIAVQSNAVLMFNAGGTDGTGGWAASDVGDYTNWTTGEAASGTVYAPQGGFTSAVAFGNDVYAFKANSIHRFTYVGGDVKWQVQTAWVGDGVPYSTGGNGVPYQDWAVATKHGIVFYGGNTGVGGDGIYLFDGASPPRRLNPDTTIPVATIMGVFTYNPVDDVVTISPSQGSSANGANAAGALSFYYYYSFPADAWGTGFGNAGEIPPSAQSTASGVLRGDWANRYDASPRPTFWMAKGNSSTDMRRNSAAYPTGAYCQVVSHKYGRIDGKTTFDWVQPVLRRRTDLGTDSAICAMELFREREDTTATVTRNNLAESGLRKRFDLKGGACSDNFGRFYVLWTNLDIEVDDLMVKSSFVPNTQ